jgi:hypothetical protein
MNVHFGRGKGDHDDCRAEALLTGCKARNNEQIRIEREPSVTLLLHEALKTIVEDHTWQDINEQITKDITTNVAQVIVNEAAEQERQTKLKRFKENTIVPIVHALDTLENRCPGSTYVVLMYYHFIVLITLSILSAGWFGLALVPTSQGITWNGISMHTATVVASVHVGLLGLALWVRSLGVVLQRKQQIVENFLREVVTLNLQDDIGISVEEAAALIRQWTDRLVVSSITICALTMMIWYHAQAYSPLQQQEYYHCGRNNIACVTTKLNIY